MRKRRKKREDGPSIDYLEKIRRIGKREGESLISFVKRVSALKAGRAFAFTAWKQTVRDKNKFVDMLGISRKNVHNELKRLGLNYEILDEMLTNENAHGRINSVHGDLNDGDN